MVVHLGSMKRLTAALALEDGERLLDVGCGTGICATLARGIYVGCDTFVPYLDFCRRRAAGRSHLFVAMNAANMCFGDRAFDKAIVTNMVHHLDNSAADRMLAELRRVVRKRVVLMDAALDIANPIERFVLSHDRGDYLRDGAALRSLLSRHFDIEDQETFHNTLHFVPQIVFRLVPRVL
jgi:ubiquinone/menaquinone biosynthesis C-methylase UbiE